MSDVHAEFYRNELNWLPPLPDHPDVLVLAGDIHVGKALIDFVTRVSAALPNTHIVFIAGIGTTRLVSNQFCYPNERWKSGCKFDSQLIFRL